MELAVGQAQAGPKRAQMQNRGFGDTLSYRDRGLTQEAKYPLGIKPADPVLVEQPGQRRLAQACGLGRGGRQRPQIQDPLGGHIVAHLEQLWIVAPELLADAVREAHAFVLELFSQARPLPQCNHGGGAGLDGPEQVRVRAQSAGCDPSVAPVILRPSEADAVAQAVELLGWTWTPVLESLLQVSGLRGRTRLLASHGRVLGGEIRLRWGRGRWAAEQGAPP